MSVVNFRVRPFFPVEKNASNHLTGCCLCPRTDLDILGRIKVSCPCQDSNPGSSTEIRKEVGVAYLKTLSRNFDDKIRKLHPVQQVHRTKKGAPTLSNMKELKHQPVYRKLQHYHTILTPHLLQTKPKKKKWGKKISRTIRESKSVKRPSAVLRTSLASVYNLWHLTHTNDHVKSNYVPQNAPFNSHYIPKPTKLWRNSCPAGVIFTEMQIPCSEQISRTWRNSIGLCLRDPLLPLTTEDEIIIETHFMWRIIIIIII